MSTIDPVTPLRPAPDDRAWSAADAEALYAMPGWGLGYFRVNGRGHVEAVPRPRTDPGRAIDLSEVLDGLKQRGLASPVLIRLPDLIEDRLHAIRGAFDDAIEREEYRGGYHCVYPIKVNQQRHLCEHIRDICAGIGFGLEAGSKPELLAVLGMTGSHPDMPIICNGFKDDEFVETTTLATKLGRKIIPVVESMGELVRIIEQAERYGVRPEIGVRVKPSASGAGKWAESGGERSKFGLHASELIAALDYLKSHGMADCLKLVHCHAGSQMCEIRQIKSVVSELARVYCELRRLGAGVEYLDVGGGLGIDYDGSRSAWASSTDYTLAEYAGDVIYRVKAACDDEEQPHPTIITESGRAIAAHGSVLIFDVIGKTGFPDDPELDRVREQMEAEDDVPQPVLDLVDAYESITGVGSGPRSLAEAYHDASQARDEALSLFNLGYCSLPMRSAAERLYWAVGKAVMRAAFAKDTPTELADLKLELPRMLSDIYFCNLSIFQRLPDSWAIDQLFPVVPIHRLDEKPTARAIFADVTCDSDGQIDRFGCDDQRDYKHTLEVHELELASDGTMRAPYHLGLFLTGAYQEVLGDLHNLFGDTHAVHVTLDDDAGWRIEEVIEGDTVRDVLGYVQYDTQQLRESMRREAEQAVRRGDLSVKESRSLLRFYDSGLAGYTYLEE
ncbi:MAG: biosynthetic arginine decarboxylase [Planctomycetota bacterium]